MERRYHDPIYPRLLIIALRSTMRSRFHDSWPRSKSPTTRSMVWSPSLSAVSPGELSPIAPFVAHRFRLASDEELRSQPNYNATFTPLQLQRRRNARFKTPHPSHITTRLRNAASASVPPIAFSAIPASGLGERRSSILAEAANDPETHQAKCASALQELRSSKVVGHRVLAMTYTRSGSRERAVSIASVLRGEKSPRPGCSRRLKNNA
jgi:hypothetical protein